MGKSGRGFKSRIRNPGNKQKAPIGRFLFGT
jgi:hypothetical protein